MHKVQKTILLGLLLMFFSAYSMAQGKLDVFGQLKSEMSDLRSAEVKISEDGGAFQNLKFSARTGKFDLALPIGHVFTFEFSHAGCISKQIEISTKCPENYSDYNFEPFYFSVQLELYSETPAIDTLFYDRPVGKVYFSETYEKFEYDREYILYVRNHIKNAVEQQLMASMKSQSDIEALLASSNSLKNIDRLMLEKQILENFSPNSAKASDFLLEKKPKNTIPELLADNTISEGISTQETKLVETDNSVPIQVATPAKETPEKKELPEAAQKTPSVKVGPAKDGVKKNPTVIQEKVAQKPTRNAVRRPATKKKTKEPQFKQRPERKTFENVEFPEGLWTRIFINEGSRITKYTMIQYNTGRISYYKQDQYETDSVKISKSIFMRMISY